jgi:hypothetical protein
VQRQEIIALQEWEEKKRETELAKNERLAKLAADADRAEKEAKQLKNERLKAIKEKANKKKAATAQIREAREAEADALKRKAEDDELKAQDLIRKKHKTEEDREAFELKTANYLI